MAGIINSVLDTTRQIKNPLDNPLGNSSTIAQAKPFGYDPTLATVNQQTDTVAGQIGALLQKDNPLVQASDARVAQDYNARGLVNSSMMTGAAEKARIETALPIASQDASTYSQQRMANQGYGNTADQFGATAANSAGQFNAGASNEFAKIGATTQAQTGLIGAQGAETRATQAAGAEQTSALSAQQAGQAQTLQAQQGDIQKQLATIQASTTLTVADKNAALQTALQQAQSSTQMTLADKSAAQQTIVTQMELNSRAELQRIQNDTTLTVADKQAAQSRYNADLAATTQLQVQSLDNTFKTAYQTADIESKKALDAADNAIKMSLAYVDANYKTLMQTSASATSMFQSAMGMIQNVVADSTIPAPQKATLINGYLGWMQQGMATVSAVNGVDTGDLLNFSTVSA